MRDENTPTRARFSGSRVLITGAAGGIGRAVVSQFRAEGALLAVADKDTVDLDADAHFPGDLTDPHYCDTLCEKTVAALGGLDILINNAGVNTRGAVTDSSDEDFNLSMAVNVAAPFRLCRAAIPLMANSGGGASIPLPVGAYTPAQSMQFIA